VRGRPRTAWINNISMWTKLSVEGSVRMTNDRDQWRKCIRPWCDQPSDQGWLMTWTELNRHYLTLLITNVVYLTS